MQSTSTSCCTDSRGPRRLPRVRQQTHAHITEQGEAIKLLARDRKTLRQQRAKKDATIARLRARIASLEATVMAQEDQLREMEEDDGADRETKELNAKPTSPLQNLANQGHGNHDHPGSKLENFQNTNPPVFSKTEEPLDADDWLQSMENNLEVAGVEANEKVLFATHYLAGPAEPGGLAPVP
ncbi:hypothetical protein QYE76_037994 [Lolium multiflorum]|uniref:Uncharacterized protein n=1 Tax=Lolium multiflorum TaxID=4521 RepID=A0AAD8WSH6_LOLMU|nr:hypothetical protein QYE76_037994 [Lolium multiflorum]